jgi:hypothetical protein
MSTRLVLLTTLKIHAGRLDAFKASVLNAIEFANAHGPQLLVAVSVNEQNMHAYTCEIQPNPENLAEHWRIAEPQMSELMNHCTLLRLEVHGTPSAWVRQRLLQLAEHGVALTIRPQLTGFQRLP